MNFQRWKNCLFPLGRIRISQHDSWKKSPLLSHASGEKNDDDDVVAIDNFVDRCALFSFRRQAE